VEGDVRTEDVAPMVQRHVLILLDDTDPAAIQLEPPASEQALPPSKSSFSPDLERPVPISERK
jgi:hypothetical protein